MNISQCCIAICNETRQYCEISVHTDTRLQRENCLPFVSLFLLVVSLYCPAERWATLLYPWCSLLSSNFIIKFCRTVSTPTLGLVKVVLFVLETMKKLNSWSTSWLLSLVSTCRCLLRNANSAKIADFVEKIRFSGPTIEQATRKRLCCNYTVEKYAKTDCFESVQDDF